MSSFLTVDGLSIRYWSNVGDKGSSEHKRPSIVLFHGNAFSLDDWISTGTLDLLAKQGFNVYAVDLPAGRGSKSSKVEKKDLLDYVPIMEGIFAKFGIGVKTSPIVLIGPSMGGGFALAFAITHPEAVSALVLVSPSVRAIKASSLASLKMPALLIWGDRDNVFPFETHGKELKNQLLHSKLLILKGAGHAAYIDKPNEFHEILLDFLGEAL